MYVCIFRICRPYSFLVGYFLFIYLFCNLFSLCVYFFAILISLLLDSHSSFFSLPGLSIYSFCSHSLMLHFGFFFLLSLSVFMCIYCNGEKKREKKEEKQRKKKERVCKQINNTPVVSVSVYKHTHTRVHNIHLQSSKHFFALHTRSPSEEKTMCE